MVANTNIQLNCKISIQEKKAGTKVLGLSEIKKTLQKFKFSELANFAN